MMQTWILSKPFNSSQRVPKDSRRVLLLILTALAQLIIVGRGRWGLVEDDTTKQQYTHSFFLVYFLLVQFIYIYSVAYDRHDSHDLLSLGEDTYKLL